MSVLRQFENDEYQPEFSTLVLRDTRPAPAGPPAADPGLLGEYTTSVDSATVVCAGYGWLHALASDAYQTVRLELHDDPPAPDPAGWDDVAETPYTSATGALGLATVTGGEPAADLDLAAPGRYRVRLARRRGWPDGDLWRLQFWAEPEPELPRWLARGEPAARPAPSDWDQVLDRHHTGLLRAMTQAGEAGATVAELGAAAGPDTPLWQEPYRRPPTGHPDIDAAAEQSQQRWAADQARERDRLAGIAAQLGVPAPATGRDMLPLLLAAGLVVVDDSGDEPRYRPAADPPRARDVLDLPPDLVAVLDRQEAHTRYGALAVDIATVLAWSPGHAAALSGADLAERLLAGEPDVRAALLLAADAGMVQVDDPPADPAAPVPLRLLPRRPPPPLPVVASRPAGPPWGRPTGPRPATDAMRAALVAGRAATPPGVRQVVARITPDGWRPRYHPPLGAPPRVGFVGQAGDVVVWRDGEPTVLARLDWRPYQALETGHGVVMAGSSDTVQVRPDGEVRPLGTGYDLHPAVSPDGRYLGTAESHFGRHRSWHRLHLVDLADGSRRTLEQDCPLRMVAVRDGAVLFLRVWPTGDGPLSTHRWAPGSDPEPLPYRLQQLDPISGTLLTGDDEPGVVVVGPDGTSRRVLVDLDAALTPGGTARYTYRHTPPAITLYDPAAGADRPRVHWLPPGSRLPPGPARPVWEDADHLVVTVENGERGLGAPAVRLDVRTGEFEGVPLTADAGYRPLLIQPLLR